MFKFVSGGRACYFNTFTIIIYIHITFYNSVRFPFYIKINSKCETKFKINANSNILVDLSIIEKYHAK